ncbi:galactokinase [Glaciecola pallidula DSM 14239 = ACAM 615]|uniref:Galactokinase n=2 Tax=Brumicola TaxID=3160924 RepID=K6YDK9_9ALTE|nr:galactokinase [Glaciecola pallidula DSM 14239 = ACAM 615]
MGKIMTKKIQDSIFYKTFVDIYASYPAALSNAPGRVNLIGEFTDYNNGFVLPCALQYSTRILFKKRSDTMINVYSTHYPGEAEKFDVSQEIVPGDSQWGNYIRAVAFVFKREGFLLHGFDMLIDSDVPQGSGLSSSAALEVSVGGMFNYACELGLSPAKIAVLGQSAENDFIDCQCGVMDQMISACGIKGHAMLLDCESLETRAVAIPDDLAIVIVNSNYPRRLVDSEYNQRRIDCEQAARKMQVSTLRAADMVKLNTVKDSLSLNEYKRAHHVISENQRVLDAVDALKNNDMAVLRELMSASHYSLKYDFEVTVPATDGLVKICATALQGRGAVRMTGGGFGGAIVCLCRTDDIASITNAVEAEYEKQFNLVANVYVCTVGEGLKVTEIV